MRTANIHPLSPGHAGRMARHKAHKTCQKTVPCILDEPKTIGHYLEPLKDIASNPDRQRLLKEFFQETYV